MKNLFKFIFTSLAGASLLTACEKKEGPLPFYGPGSAPALTASSTTIAPPPADSLKSVLTLSWSNPKYASDSATFKYVVQMGAQGTNFATSVSRTFTGVLSASYIAKDLNNMLLAWGYDFGKAYDIDVRVISSYANNNEVYQSNVIKIKMTPYKVPPKVALPAGGELFLVGDATAGDWGNPVPVPSQQFSRLDETTWAGVFNLKGGKQYLVLPENGSWENKYSVANNTLPELNKGGDFLYNANDNFPGPATDGFYTITLDFQRGKFTVVPFTSTLPSNLFIVGAAVPAGWNNPVPANHQLVRNNSSHFSIVVDMSAAGEYLLLPVNGSWDNKYSVADKNVVGLSAGGTFGYNLPDNFPGPATAGTYKVEAEFATMKFKVTKQ